MKSSFLVSLLHIYFRNAGATSNQTTNDRTCYYEPFFFMQPSPLPTCSLSATPGHSIEAPPELLSFDEWKQARQVAANSLSRSIADLENASHAPSIPDDEALLGVVDGLSSGEASGTSVQSFMDRSTFQVPLTDRFNYASQDCTARVYSSQKGIKSPSSILSSKKDRYMLSPCGTKDKYVVIELCDDVKIDTVQLANYEFFSGVFKDIRISLAETIPADASGWIDGGTHRAKNNRAVQSFHPLEGRRQFYRYIRIDFLSHYGNEFYCPVSLLRVYGLTHMEDFRWASWQAETGAIPEPVAPPAVELVPVPINVISDELPLVYEPPLESDTSFFEEATSTPDVEPSLPATVETSMIVTSASDGENSVHFSREGQPKPKSITTTQGIPDVTSSCTSSLSSIGVATASLPQDALITTSTGISASTINSPSDIGHTSEPSPRPTITLHSSEVMSGPTTTSTLALSIVTTPSPVHSPSVSNPSSSNSQGESIYRIIMKRLDMLENNSTLSMKYVEEQTLSVRQVVRRLEEDVGRLDALGRRNYRIFERTLDQMDKHQKEVDSAMKNLSDEVHTLAREVALEKRLGFLQLCLLICAFIFMALTRGAPDSTAIAHMGARGLRRLNSLKSGDWTKSTKAIPETPSRRGYLRALPPRPPQQTPRKQSFVERFQFPEAGPSKDSNAATTRQGRQRVASSPSMPGKQRYSSPRRLAAHLHEVKPTSSTRRHPIELEDTVVEIDPFSTPRGSRILSPSGTHSSDKRRRPRSREHPRTSDSVISVTENRQTLPAKMDKVDDASEWSDTTTEDENDDAAQPLKSKSRPFFPLVPVHATPSPSHSPSQHRTSIQSGVVMSITPHPLVV